MKQPHEHIADAYQGRTGSPFQSDRDFRQTRHRVPGLVPWRVLIGLAIIGTATAFVWGFFQ